MAASARAAVNREALSGPENSGTEGPDKAGADAAFSMVRQRKKGRALKARPSHRGGRGGAGARALVTARREGEGPHQSFPSGWEQNVAGGLAEGPLHP